MTNTVREAVQMVLTRMETHPDDFYDNDQLVRHSSPRFGWVWNAINGSGSYGLNGAEIDALKQGYDKVMYRKFHDRVLESMLNEPETYEKMAQQGSSLKYNPQNRAIPPGTAINVLPHQQNAALSNTSFAGVISANSVQVGKQTLTEALVQKLKNL